MRKKRILFCSEATFLNTGYATYTREILNYLHGTGKYEIAEMSSYGQRNDPRAANIPWQYYGVSPNTDCEPKASEEELKAFCKENLTGYKIPKHYEFRDELPKSNVGKIIRRHLRE